MGAIILLSSFNNTTVHNEGSDKTCLLEANHKEISSSEVYKCDPICTRYSMQIFIISSLKEKNKKPFGLKVLLVI